MFVALRFITPLSVSVWLQEGAEVSETDQTNVRTPAELTRLSISNVTRHPQAPTRLVPVVTLWKYFQGFNACMRRWLRSSSARSIYSDWMS